MALNVSVCSFWKFKLTGDAKSVTIRRYLLTLFFKSKDIIAIGTEEYDLAQQYLS
jgi:hypothetical protein